MNVDASASSIANTPIHAIIRHRAMTPANHVENVRYSFGGVPATAGNLPLYRLSAIAIATKLVASCAIVPSVAR